MSTAAKKPPVGGRDPAVSPSSSPSSRQTPRASTPSSSPAAGTGSPARSRSLRGGNPVSARAAAHQRTQSRLNMSTSAAGGAGGDGSNPPSDTEENARAETVALLDDLRERLSKAEGASEQYKRQAEVLQSRLDEALREQAKLEEHVHEHEEQVEALRNSERDAAREIREMETIYEAERSSMTKEKEDMANREEEMQTIIQRLKDSLAQRANGADDETRPSRQSNNSSPTLDGGNFAPPSSVQRSDSRNNSKLLLQKDKLIESLRLELAEAQIKLVESENQGGGRQREVERLLVEARMANARLMEDNESYQLLLQERTLKGDFGQSDFSYMAPAANQDALNALEGRSAGATSLADELSEAAESEQGESYRRLETELKSMRDQNKALTLYINRIIERLLQHQDFESILDQSSDFKPPNTNKELPPAPQASGSSLLQRAKSMAIGNSSSQARPRPRPMSVMPPPPSSAGSASSSAHNNPETAPSIPIGLSRNTSVRRSRPMSEQFSAHAASVVNHMYKGPEGAMSPPLRGSGGAFFLPQGVGNRISSGASAPPGLATSGNFPGETSSTSGDSGTGDVSTPPSQSPPRPHEKSTTFAGNKPRPLRLVQENAELPATPPAGSGNKRASAWVNWAFGKKDEAGAQQAVPGEAAQE